MNKAKIMLKKVVLAPVPWVHLESMEKKPKLFERVAFGTSRLAVTDEYATLSIFIYGSGLDHTRHRSGVVTWTGFVDKIERAVQAGQRSGQHPDKSLRPMTAEDGDTAFIRFLEVTNIQLLNPPLPLTRFTKEDGKGKPFTGPVPRWPVLAFLQDPPSLK